MLAISVITPYHKMQQWTAIGNLAFCRPQFTWENINSAFIRGDWYLQGQNISARKWW